MIDFTDVKIDITSNYSGSDQKEALYIITRNLC